MAMSVLPRGPVLCPPPYRTAQYLCCCPLVPEEARGAASQGPVAAIPGAGAGLQREGREAAPAGHGGEAAARPCDDLCVSGGSQAKSWTGPRSPWGRESQGMMCRETRKRRKRAPPGWEPQL